VSGTVEPAGALGPRVGASLARQRSFGLRTRLVSAEVMKIRTTAAWWLFLGGFVVLGAMALFWNWESNHNILHPTLSDYFASGRAAVLAQAASARTTSGAAAMAASMMTSGQFLLLLVAVMLGVYLVTGEFAARTITSTFLVTPRRGLVVAAKLATAAAFGFAFWAIATVLDGAVTPLFLSAQHLPLSAFGSADVLRAVMTGLLAYMLWSLFGLGLGALLRNQVVAVVAAIAIYAGGFVVIELIVHLLYDAFHASWLLSLAVLAPAQASNVMITAGKAFAHAPPWWVGTLVMAGYGATLSVCGAALIRRADVT
jgi:ABC-2 type transport system permease protein